MNEFIDIMLRPFVACLILTGIHTYLGLHVIERGVIFVDLALAQMAALGACIALLFGFILHSPQAYFCGLGLTVVGALALAATRFRRPVVPHEAIIGIVYAVAGALSILVLSRAPEGGEELKALLVGHLLFVGWEEIAKILLLYLSVGVVHWIFRKTFILISCRPDEAFAQGLRVRLWDFLFYVLFGIVVTSSVELAGVLLVFSFLIVPAVCGVLLARGILGRLMVGWGISLLTSVVGIILSYQFDFPTGATIVAVFGLSLAACGLAAGIRSKVAA